MSIHLTPRELEILKLIAFEYSSLEIAKKLFVSNHTVLTHRKNLLQKVKAKNTAGLVRKGFELGYLDIYTGLTSGQALN